MRKQDRPLQAAILGAQGMGKLHAQILSGLGANICAVLGSTEHTAAMAAKELERAYGIRAQAFSRLADLLRLPNLDAVSICTPPELHFEQTLMLLDSAIPVFCEKPLFWHRGITVSEVDRQLACLASHAHRRLFMNSSHADLIDSIVHRLPPPHAIDSFFFQYHTQGRYRGKAIAGDLLPHGLSLLLRLLGMRDMDDRTLQEEITPHTYGCRLDYGDCLVQFDFQEREDGPKALVFAINGKAFTRIQVGAGATYRLFLYDNEREERVDVPHPLRAHLSRFLDFCRTNTHRDLDGFEDAANNMRLMARILI